MGGSKGLGSVGNMFAGSGGAVVGALQNTVQEDRLKAKLADSSTAPTADSSAAALQSAQDEARRTASGGKASTILAGYGAQPLDSNPSDVFGNTVARYSNARRILMGS